MAHTGFKEFVRGVAIATLALAWMPAAMAQQDAPAAAAAPDQQQSPWVKQCQTDKQSNKRLCITSQITALSKDVIPSISIREGAAGKYIVALLVPIGVQLPPGVALAVDGDKKATAQFVSCDVPSQEFPFPVPSCAAQTEVDEGFITSLRKGNELELVVVDRRNQARPIPLTLIGFAKIFDGPGVDPQTAQQLQNDRIRQLNEENRKALADKLKQLQKQQSGG